LLKKNYQEFENVGLWLYLNILEIRILINVSSKGKMEGTMFKKPPCNLIIQL